MDIRKLLEEGHAALDAGHATREIAKLGNLRIGSAGTVSDGGEIFGECHRKALARMLGDDKKVPFHTKIMFQSGRFNEDAWYEVLSKSWPGKIMREEEIPITWQVPGSEVNVLGRPDMILCDEHGTPVHGLELKGVYSANTAKAVHQKGEPQTKHLIQAAAYSLFLNIPYTLCYTSASVIGTVAASKIQPFYRMFYLEWDDSGRLSYSDEFGHGTVQTLITKQGIRDFYSLVVEMREKKKLGPRPAKTEMDGRKQYWDICDAKYCPYSAACSNYDEDQDFDVWVSSFITKENT